MMRALLYAVVALGVMALLAEAMHWVARLRPRRRGLDPREYDVPTLAAHRARRAQQTTRGDGPQEAA